MKIAMLISGCGSATLFAALVVRMAPLHAAPPVATTPRPVSPSPTVPARFQPVGAGSCSARACHGGAEPMTGSSVLRTEHTTWILRDRHAQAYQVLGAERSRKIVERLGWKSPANQEERCLACHATPVHGLPDREAEPIRQDGVGCESCHGPSSRWISEHTTYTWARDRATGQAAGRFGMIPVDQLTVRARTCAGCHVGSPAEPENGYPLPRDVNHDLIAAGHPRLAFELSSYLDRMPRHWPERETQARTWAVGQVETAAAALDLLADRVTRAKADPDRTPWPEFSEYSCYECHFPLDGKSGGRSRNRAPGELGQPTWGGWSTPMLIELAKPQAGAALPNLESDLAELRRAMRLPAPPIGSKPDQVNVGPMARRISAALDLWLQNGADRAFDRDRLVATLGKPHDYGQGRPLAGWDQAAQLYLALRTLNLGDGGASPPGGPIDKALDAELRDLRCRLLFPPGLDGPKGFQP